MQDQATASAVPQPDVSAPGHRFQAARAACREVTLRTALRKRQAGGPTYSVPEAAALLSVSPEHLYRLVKADAFPAVRMRTGGDQGRYVVPARAVERLLDAATASGGCVDIAEWAQGWNADLAARAGVPA